MNKKQIISSAFASSAFLASAVAVFAAGTVVISGNTSAGENQPGWMFNRDLTTQTPYEFNTNAASIGTGSLYVKPIGANAADKFIAENFVNTPVSNVNAISYDFKIGSGGEEADKVHFYMNVYANFGVSDDLKFYDCRYNVVPSVGSLAGFTTVTFDPTQAYPVTTRGGASASPFACPAVPADMDTLSPGSNIRAFALNVGDTSVNDLGLDGYLDKVVVNMDTDNTTYDFEPAPILIGPPTTKDECKDGGWQTFNNPAFNNKAKCLNYVKKHDHTIMGNNLRYMAGGLLRYAEFNMNTADQKGSFSYEDGNRDKYKVKVMKVKADGANGWFAGEVTKASNPAWVGLWLFAKVIDGEPDMIWGSFTDETTAKTGVDAMSDPSSGPFAIIKGNLKVK